MQRCGNNICLMCCGSGWYCSIFEAYNGACAVHPGENLLQLKAMDYNVKLHKIRGNMRVRGVLSNCISHEFITFLAIIHQVLFRAE